MAGGDFVRAACPIKGWSAGRGGLGDAVTAHAVTGTWLLGCWVVMAGRMALLVSGDRG